MQNRITRLTAKDLRRELGSRITIAFAVGKSKEKK